ncbi:lariat debranching enzyme, C-terminal domain-containing protein [Gymnopilus junonius]|uniref:Lariat debranching enzyme, C-terminal domain-containing protein n=1 Tax=Gymnopilus junonius TaxID=109634 RepID=A0A9P5TNX7_GYMJU|nr:lariat debranching enzyme, C-terminal domain-containing protein [Gymnopilus junonius]
MRRHLNRVLPPSSMKIAVEGCCHGELDAIYKHIAQLESRNKYKVDALLVCGDFQAVRNWRDLQCMAVPNKFKELHDFHKYYTGKKTAPILTLVIGGNHEASNYLWELYHGGWLAPNIYFLGHAGCVRLNGVRIAGASGIFKGPDFRLGHYEKVPYDAGSMRSIYHIREYNVRRLSLLSSSQIFLSHDWPSSIEHYGDLDGLLRRKTFFKEDVKKGTLGSPPLMGLLMNLKPEWWFAAHLHTRFEAMVLHDEQSDNAQAKNPDEIQIDNDVLAADQPMKSDVGSPSRNPDEITLDDEEETVVVPLITPPSTASKTKFLALDKCLPRRDFLEVIDIDTTNTNIAKAEAHVPLLSFDPEWLAITRAFHPWLSTTRHQPSFPEEIEARALVASELEWVEKNVEKDTNGAIPVMEHQSFAMTAPGPGSEGADKSKQPPWYTNPQTEAFCRMLDIPNKINPPPTTREPTKTPAGS